MCVIKMTDEKKLLTDENRHDMHTGNTPATIQFKTFKAVPNITFSSVITQVMLHLNFTLGIAIYFILNKCYMSHWVYIQQRHNQ